MEEVVLEVGHHTKFPDKLGFRVRMDGDDQGSVRDMNALLKIKNQIDSILEETPEAKDPDLKTQFEIMIQLHYLPHKVKRVKVEYRQVPGSGVNGYVISHSMDIYHVLKSMFTGTVAKRKKWV